MSEEEQFSCTPPNIRKTAEEAITNLLPTKSRAVYEKEYSVFNSWCIENSVHNITENVVLAYYEKMSKGKKSSTLWASYSMLRACLNVYRNIDISKFVRLQSFLKRQSDGYQPKKSKILEMADINQFLNEADDLSYLAMKVILIMGYSGACRRDELTKMSTDDIEYKEDNIIVSVPKTKTNMPRLFIIIEVHWINLIKRYANLRPNNVTSKRFFLTYRNGRCVISPIGINKISQVPRIIASFLKLPNPERYTGHCFRRSSASHLANHGGDLVTIKRHGGWKSSAVAEGYIEQSLSKKKQVAEMLRTSSSAQPSTSTSSGTYNFNVQEENEYDCQHDHSDVSENPSTRNIQGNANYQQNVFAQNLPGISINAKDTCNVTIKVYNNCRISAND